jgi:ZIP family zinc transporter
VLSAFGWGFLAAASLLLGAALVYWHAPKPRALGLVMGFGAGVLLSAVAYELVEEAVETSGGSGGTFAGFGAGALVFYAGDRLISRLGYEQRKDIDASAPDASPLTIVLGTFLDGVPESAVLGLTLLQTGSIGVSMLVAVLISNVPEAVAATSSLRAADWPTSRVFLLWAAIALASGAASAAGYALLDGASPATLAFILAFAGGAILTMLSTSMIPEAYEHGGRVVGLLTTVGFAVAFGISWLEG